MPHQSQTKRMNTSTSSLAIPGESACPRGRTLRDLLIVCVLAGIVIANSAAAPSQTYAYAQLLQCGASVGMMESGDWLLPRNQYGAFARKPQVLTWCQVVVLWLTGVYDDITYKAPTILASLVTAALVYLIARRWYGTRTGLVAACLWVVCHHMAKEMYVGLTDMMTTMWLTGSVLCADRLLFHRAARARRMWWTVGLWATMAAGALTKGWGVVNVTLVGGVLALATATRPGFGVLSKVDGWPVKLSLTLRLILRRWRRAMRSVHLIVGLIVLAIVLIPVWWGMLAQGGEEFQGIARYELVNRVIGGSDDEAPSEGSAPQWANLLYYALPATVLAIAALGLTARTPWPRTGRWYLRGFVWLRGASSRWFNGRNPVFLPLCWVVAIVGLFSIPHGSRPDYLLPSFAGVAMMGAWAVAELDRRGGPIARNTNLWRHVVAAAPVVIGAGLIVLPAAYLFGLPMPTSLRMPSYVPSATWYVLAALPAAGAVLLAWAIRSSLRWRLWTVAALAIIGMPGVMFVDRHFISRHARSRDGEKMVVFARTARPIVGDDNFAVYRMGNLAIEPYLGRFGVTPTGWRPGGEVNRQRAWTVESLEASGVPWLFTCDQGLRDLSVGRAADLAASDSGVRLRSEPVTDRVSNSPREQKIKWGKMYLIRLKSVPPAERGGP